MCASTANWTDQGRTTPSAPSPRSSAPFPGPSPLCSLGLSCFSSACHNSYSTAWRDGSRCGSGVEEKVWVRQALRFRCKRFTWWVPIRRSGSLDEPGAFQELNKNSVHKRVLAKGLHQHHSLLPQHVQHSRDVQHLIVFQTSNHDLWQNDDTSSSYPSTAVDQQWRVGIFWFTCTVCMTSNRLDLFKVW